MIRSTHIGKVAWLFAMQFTTMGAAKADDMLANLKAANIEACMKAGVHPKDAPKKAELVEPYCKCVTDAYWDSVPKASINQLITEHHSPDVADNYRPRMAAAKAVCKKKLDF